MTMSWRPSRFCDKLWNACGSFAGQLRNVPAFRKLPVGLCLLVVLLSLLLFSLSSRILKTHKILCLKRLCMHIELSWLDWGFIC